MDWPKRPDGTPKLFTELTAEERDQLVKAAQENYRDGLAEYLQHAAALKGGRLDG